MQWFWIDFGIILDSNILDTYYIQGSFKFPERGVTF